jgi:LuxR family maltose regulon positive regulatory protein
MAEAPTAAFARTKIQPPRPRADLVARAALEASLGRALATQRVTLLLAPAGWGKTAALARQLGLLAPGTALAWVTADEDDDVPRFLAALAAALEPLALPWRVSPAAIGTLSEGHRGLRQVADEIVNALAEAELPRGLIVIDDVHRLADLRLFEFFAALVDRLPVRWGLALASRTEPPLPLARWRARGELAEFRQGALRFEATEVQALLHQQGLADDRAEELLRRTEGWAAGLRLMLSVGASSAASTHRLHVFDFLADEVLAGMSAPLRQFLLRCALLPELTPARCAHVSGMPQALALFEQVEREGLFVTPLDAEGRTLRLHDLFRDFLEDRLQRDHADELPALLLRAADGEPDLARAVGWLGRAGAWDRAAAELAARGPGLVPRGGGPGIERLLGLFPADALERQPKLETLRAQCALHAFDFERAAAVAARAAAGHERAGQLEAASRARVFQHVGEMSCGRQAQARDGLLRLLDARPGGVTGALVAHHAAWLAYSESRHADVAAHFEDALSQFERLNNPEVWHLAHFVCILSGLPGMPPLMARFLRSVEPVAGDHARLLRAGSLHVRAALAFGNGRIDEARGCLASADDDLHWLGRPRSLLTENLMLHLAVDALHGDHAACAEAAALLRADFKASGRANQRTYGHSALLIEARAAWALGDAAWLRRVVAEVSPETDPYEWSFAPLERSMLQGMLALLDGRDAEAERLLLPRPGPIEDLVLCRGGHGLLLAVEAQRRQARLDAAAALLRRWFESVDAGAPIGGALMAGATVCDALAAAPWGARLTAPQLARLRELAALARGQTAPATLDAARQLPAGLTGREAEVLALVAEGQSNKQIARALDLSPFTVKRHVANILNKTATASRTEVAAWWVAQRR